MFEFLETLNNRPEPFQFYTAEELWNNEYTSAQMLSFHLNESIDVSSRNTDFISRSARWIASYFDLNPHKSVADFGCGPGLYTSRLAQTGCRTTGIDFSERSIAYARRQAEEHGLKISYKHENYLDFSTEEKFDLIIMIMCDFCALSPEQRKRMIEKFYFLLNKNGAVLLDVYSYHAFEVIYEKAEYECNLLNGFWMPEKYYGFLNIFKYPREKVILDKYTIISTSEVKTIYNWLQYFSPDTLSGEFEASGFKFESQYSDVAGSPYSPDTSEFAAVFRK